MKTDIELLEYFNLGFEDELNGSTKEITDPQLKVAYDKGVALAFFGDDQPSLDYISSDVYLEQIKKEIERKSQPDVLKKFVNRLKKIGIEVELVCNYPWVYITSINGKAVTERFRAEHGFTVAFMPVRYEDHKIKFTDIGEIFKLLRKYKSL